MSDAALPTVSPPLLAWFRRYAAGYLRRHFTALRLLRAAPPSVPADEPLIVYLNHPSWWDPLVCLTVAAHSLPGRTVYAAMEAEALGRYGFFARLGCFPVERGTRAGAARFLATARAILAQPGASLWLTPHGAFRDPRQQPQGFEPGLGHLAAELARQGRGHLLPLALEYPFWDERLPEALAAWGTSHPAAAGPTRAPEWTRRLEDSLTATQQALAAAACARDPARFVALLAGRTGVGGVYDGWRRLRARLHGERFDPAHGAVGARGSG